MALKDILKRKDKSHSQEAHSEEQQPEGDNAPAVTFLRTDTHIQEVIKPPSFSSDTLPAPNRNKKSLSVKRSPRFRSSSNASTNSIDAEGKKRLSSLLHLRRGSHDPTISANVPADLPVISDTHDGLEKEAQWENRATMLARSNTTAKDHTRGTNESPAQDMSMPKVRAENSRQISDAKGDDDIQEAIRLHEAGDLERSTAMFGRLADPDGANNALSQVLYGLALRHGWGIPIDLPRAITYLSQAASNSASVESQALAAGVKKGGAAKGELVLAIYELGNCFRHGWGVAKDPVAARSYYETAANLGDVDALNEVARAYEEGFGGKKDRFVAAKYYRLAEEKGSKTLGNSWIWKDKYNPKTK